MADDDADYLDRVESELDVGDEGVSLMTSDGMRSAARSAGVRYSPTSKSTRLSDNQITGLQRLAIARSFGVEGKQLVYVKNHELYQWREQTTGRFTTAPADYPRVVKQSDTNYAKFSKSR
jgi:hypothetical protein